MKVLYHPINTDESRAVARGSSVALRHETVDMGVDTIEVAVSAEGIESAIPATGREPTMTREQLERLPVVVRGSEFFCRVMEQLALIPPGEVTTYGRIAAAIGRPGASRAVGRAVGANAHYLLLPCHRVVSATGTGGFRWGVDLKRRLLAAERGYCSRGCQLSSPARTSAGVKASALSS